MCVRGFVVAPGLEDSPGQLGEALQGFEPSPQPGVGTGESGSEGIPWVSRIRPCLRRQDLGLA